MLAKSSSLLARRGAASALAPRLLGARRAMASHDAVPKYKRDFAPDLVVEGIPDDPMSQPIVYEKDIWKSPEMLLPERTELFYDDGVAQPEFYYDRDWPVSTGRACAELAGVLSFIFFTFGGIAYVIGDSYRPVDPVQNSWPFDLRKEHGLPDTAEATAYATRLLKKTIPAVVLPMGEPMGDVAEKGE